MIVRPIRALILAPRAYTLTGGANRTLLVGRNAAPRPPPGPLRLPAPLRRAQVHARVRALAPRRAARAAPPAAPAVRLLARDRPGARVARAQRPAARVQRRAAGCRPAQGLEQRRHARPRERVAAGAGQRGPGLDEGAGVRKPPLAVAACARRFCVWILLLDIMLHFLALWRGDSLWVQEYMREENRESVQKSRERADAGYTNKAGGIWCARRTGPALTAVRRRWGHLSLRGDCYGINKDQPPEGACRAGRVR